MTRTQVTNRKTARFGYSRVQPCDRKKCEEVVEKIFVYQRRMASDVVAIGRLLIGVKETLEHGQFGAWIRHYFGWSQQTASNMMRAGEMFGEVSNFGELTIDTSAVYLLASMTCPDDLREQILERAANGERITHATVREAIDELRSDDDEPVAPPVSRRAPVEDSRPVASEQPEYEYEDDDDQDEEPAPSRYQPKPFVENDDAEETERRVIEWSLAGFLVSTRRLISEWRENGRRWPRSCATWQTRSTTDETHCGLGRSPARSHKPSPRGSTPRPAIGGDG